MSNKEVSNNLGLYPVKGQQPSTMNVLAEPTLDQCLMSPLWSPVREMLCFQSLPLHDSRSPNYWSTFSRFSSRSPYKQTEALCPKPFLICLMKLSEFPVKDPSLQYPLAPIKKDSLFQEPFICLSNFPVNEPSLQVPYRCHCGESCPFPEACQHDRKCTYAVLIYKIVAKCPKKKSLRECCTFRGFRALLDPLNN